MNKCDYCGRENREGAIFCDGCGTELHRPQTPMPRHLTAHERKRGWVAVVVAVFCAIAASALAWRTSETLRTLGGYVATIGFTWAVFTLLELREPKANAQDDAKKDA